MTDAAPTATTPTTPPAAGTTIHTVREIEALIPHRHPFLLVDRIVEYDPDAKRIVSPGDTLRLEVTMEKLGSRFGRGRGVATVDGEVACEATISFVIPGEGVLR